VADTVEHHVVSLLGQHDALAGQLDFEPAADHDDGSGSLLIGYPLLAPFSGLVDCPPDLYITALPGISGRHEVPNDPAPVICSIDPGISGVDLIYHGARR
jgi:hypothetical protein